LDTIWKRIVVVKANTKTFQSQKSADLAMKDPNTIPERDKGSVRSRSAFIQACVFVIEQK
jgi:hypothetical protein